VELGYRSIRRKNSYNLNRKTQQDLAKLNQENQTLQQERWSLATAVSTNQNKKEMVWFMKKMIIEQLLADAKIEKATLAEKVYRT